MTGGLRIVVLGYVVRGPIGGMAWHHLQYVMGLRRLGHEVHFIEDSEDWPSCYDPRTDRTGTDPTYGLAFADRVFSRIGLGDRWAYHDAHTSRWFGPVTDRAVEICRSADLLLNLSGMNPLRPWLEDVPARALIDQDPAFTQIRHLTDPDARDRAEGHTAFLSFGENIGDPRCTVPDDGFPWQPTRQPVVVEAVTGLPGPADGPFTNVMLWNSYGAVSHGGVRYGMKSDSFLEFMDLPTRTGRVFELAVGSPGVPDELLRASGWLVRDPLPVSRELPAYEDYVGRSKAEFSVAKHGYVVSRSGWFSERSCLYLASGRPVLVQETGFSDWLPAGEGVVPFASLDGAVEGVVEIDRRYEFHRRAARDLVREHFDARAVLPRLIERAMQPVGAGLGTAAEARIAGSADPPVSGST